MQDVKKFGWGDAGKVALALAAVGFAWASQNQTATLAILAVIVVWMVKFLAQKTGKKVGKATLTAVLFVLSLALAVIFQPVGLPVFPVWAGDAAAFSQALLMYVAALVSLSSGLMAFATGLYNILLAKVFEKLEPGDVIS